MPGYKGWEGELPLGKQLKECLDETWFEDLAKSDKPDVAQWAKTTIENYNKLMDKYYYGPVDEGRKSNFSERLINCFSDTKLDIVIWLDGSGKVHEDKFSYDECSKEASKRYNTPIDQLTDLDIVGKFLYESYPRYRITPLLKILKDGDNKDEVIKELKRRYNKKS